MMHAFDVDVQGIIARVPPSARQGLIESVSLLRSLGVTSSDSLRAAAEDESLGSQLRGTVCWLLGRVNDRRAVYTLVRLLEDSDTIVVKESILSLGIHRNKRAVKPLLRVFRTSLNNDIREVVVYTFGSLQDAHAKSFLINTLLDASEAPRIRAAAAESLARLHGSEHDKEVVNALILSLKDESADVRYWSAFALGEIGASEAVPALEGLMNDQGVLVGWGSIAEEAREAIQQIIASRRRNAGMSL